MVEHGKTSVDLRGLSCPQPVIRTKRLIDCGDYLTVEALVDDDDVCVNNLQRLARSNGALIAIEKCDSYYKVTITKSEGAHATVSAHEHSELATQSSKSGFASDGTERPAVLFLGKDYLGEGDAEFSRTLMNVFLQTTFESGLRPQAVLLMNSGVNLLAKGSQSLKVLSDFKAAGCEVLACGLCVDFYKLKDDIPKEQITNMFAICEYLFSADRIIQP